MNHHSPALSDGEHGLQIFLRGSLNRIAFWIYNIILVISFLCVYTSVNIKEQTALFYEIKNSECKYYENKVEKYYRLSN